MTMHQKLFIKLTRKVLISIFLMGLPSIPLLSQSAVTQNDFDISRLEKEIGQMLMVGIRGTHLNGDAMKQTREHITSGEIGGIIFFKHNIKNSRQFGIFVKSIRALPISLPLLLAVDEEGGKVRRLRKSQGFTEFPSAAHVGAKMDLVQAYDIYKRMAQQISHAGLNLNLGPVVDVNINRVSPAIGQLNRSFSRNPRTVYDYSTIFIQAHHAVGVLTTLKHYPGHGSSREDTHNNLTDITHSWRKSEQLPFKRLIDSAQVDLIMAGHLFDTSIDPLYPASLSAAHIQHTLREQLGFDGVVLTDDLQMGAIIKNYKLDEIIISAVNAGCDILQFSDPLELNPNLPVYVRDVLTAAVKDGQVDPEFIHASYRRITRLKQKLAQNQEN